MAKNIKGNNDGINGGNDTYTIQGRGVVTREILVQEINEGKHPNHHVITVNGEDYVRANPNSSNEDNVNKD